MRVFGFSDGSCHLFNGSSDVATVKKHTDSIRCLALASNVLVSGSGDHSVIMYDVSSDSIIFQSILGKFSGNVNCVAFSPDSTHIYAGIELVLFPFLPGVPDISRSSAGMAESCAYL